MKNRLSSFFPVGNHFIFKWFPNLIVSPSLQPFLCGVRTSMEILYLKS
ncbi:hypothetical protein ZOSMA_226G00050 [Zostera marina]|uniref:Uncharacterized protein n=1 Tax=Zostera marina TaxID=29655 RepID=A0A0K9PIV6_ZOSMR|nr:hypothetical protein ZOSMA_226G00050 [Zostera marina]